MVPPVASRHDHVSVWHGETVVDPWYWLREKSNPEVLRYLEAENAWTEAQTRAMAPFAESLYQEMVGRIQQTDVSVPLRSGAWEYFTRTEEGRQYALHMRRRVKLPGSAEAEGGDELLLDLNALAVGHEFMALGGFEVSDDGNRLLYSTDGTGFRQYTLYLKELTTGTVLGPLAERVTSFEWAADGHTVFFVTEDAVTKRSNQLWRMVPGCGEPELILEEGDELYSVSVGRTKDRRYLVLESCSTDTWEQWLLASDAPMSCFQLILPRRKGHKYDVEHHNGWLYVRTNSEAKNFRLVKAPVTDPANWTEVVPHRDDVLLESIEMFRNHLVVQEQREGLARLRIGELQTGRWRDVGFPEPAYWATATGTPEFDARAFRLGYQSMKTPPTVYDCDLETGELRLLKQTPVPGGYQPDDYVTERRWAVARDGVRVPMSVLYRRGVSLDGTAVCHLYGYGSYGLGMEAAFSVGRISLVERGVVCVIAHIRGGNEMGEAWHDAGMLMHKKNTFTDFVDCAEWLVENRVVARDGLLIEGGSAGGLLMGAVVNLRPDLFRAVHLAVPFVDVMNTMMDPSLPLTVGEYLEWGDPNGKEAFDYMRSYSPYDNLRPGVYPAMLVTTSLNDSQVMYWEPAKYVAKLRTLKTDANPLLFKCNMGAGHGGASGRYDRYREIAFEYAWLLWQAGITH